MQIKEEEHLQSNAVLGAAGKMGCGIALLLLQQMACSLARQNHSARVSNIKLVLIDANESGFIPLMHYLENQLRKFAEKNINDLRHWYAARDDLVENREMIDCFIKSAMERVRLTTSLEEALGSNLIFEAILEDVEVKAAMFSKLNVLLGPNVYYLTNTSSIPICILQAKSGLNGRLIGLHFYNPPAVQRLVEIIVPEEIDPVLKKIALDIAKQLNKIVVFSSDVAGFIGNGHFIREIYYACQQVTKMAQQMPLSAAILLVNRLTQEVLIRPMGIFQLIDYVGIDIVGHIARIMSEYLQGESFLDPLIKDMAGAGKLGGQYGDGGQRDGFFRYEGSSLAAVYDARLNSYVPCSDTNMRGTIERLLGKSMDKNMSWKTLSKDANRMVKLKIYFQDLLQLKTPGAELAQGFMRESQKIAHGLVERGIAASVEDVDTVLKNGFFHLYGVDFPFSVARQTIKEGRQ